MTPVPLGHPTRRRLWCGVAYLVVALGLASRGVAAETSEEFSIRVIDQLLTEAAAKGSTSETVYVGCQGLTTGYLRAWRDKLMQRTTPKSGRDIQPAAASGAAINLWTDGIVYYDFEISGANAVSAVHQQAFVDAAGEYTAIAGIQFVPRTSETNYVHVRHDAGLSGGQADVGMQGGEQFITIGSWNRGTLVHEIGHCLGLIHEHQRSDRGTYVTILTGNIISGAEGNFVLLGDSVNFGAYDFESVMHYARDQFSNGGGDTVEPLPAYAQWLAIMGAENYDRPLSAGDRAALAGPAVYGPPPIAPGSVVTNTRDSGPGSLRAAIYYAWDHPGTVITFNIPTVGDPGFDGNVFTIHPTDTMTRPGPSTTIDGTTQATNQGDTNPAGPEIVLSGSSAEAGLFADGLHLRTSFVTVRGLVFRDFERAGVRITNNAAGTPVTGNIVAGCFIGTDATGAVAAPNGQTGVYLENGASGNTIGGLTAADRNVISGNAGQGVYLEDAGTNANIVAGNFIGLNAAGTASLPNTLSGVGIFSGASNNVIGGASAGAGNVISGNTLQGIAIANAGTSANRVEGNRIGTTAAGTAAVLNPWAGVEVFGGATSTVIGGTAPGAGNVISGNFSQGILVKEIGTDDTVIQGNRIGLNAAGTAALPNRFSGIEVTGGAKGTLIGGTIPGAGNVISGNTSQGIFVNGPGTDDTEIQGNRIGLNVAGTAAVPNGFSGIEVSNGPTNLLIGGFVPAARNFISGNTNFGVLVRDASTSGNVIAGNFIGLRPDGAAAGNAWSGVSLQNGTQGNLVGGGSGAANRISGNGNAGIIAYDSGTGPNAFRGNEIFANAWDGIYLNTGTNGDIPAPALSSAVLESSTHVTGTFNHTTDPGSHVIEFFANPAFGWEGRVFLGSVTDSDGGFDVILPASVPAGMFLTATVTNPSGATSRFSAPASVSITPGNDDDLDGIPDSYEDTHGLDSLVDDAGDDLDGDGDSNIAEFFAGTDPQSALSHFGPLQVLMTVGGVEVTLPDALAGRNYRFDASDDLLTWQPFAFGLVPSAPGPLTVLDPAALGKPRRFYRAVVVP